MKYAVNYWHEMPMQSFDEIIIDFEQQKEAHQLEEFLRAHLPARIIVSVNDIDAFLDHGNWFLLNDLYKKIDNFSIRFLSHHQFTPFNDKLQLAISKIRTPFFTGHIITTFEQLHYVLKQGVHEVYIAEGLGFELDKVKAVCAQYKNNILVRCFANVAQSEIKTTSPIKKFFIRPEDVKKYEQYIDTIEFWGPDQKQFILHKIYQKGIWGGDIQELILDLDVSFDSRCVVPFFGTLRPTCGRACLEGVACEVCEKVVETSKTLRNNNIKLSTESL